MKAVFHCLILSGHPLLTSAVTVDLPGIDVLSAGYDAASWNQKAGEPKYRIFDLSAAGNEVHVPSIGKTYTAPALVSVVTDGPQCERIEDSCEGVATTFESYLHTHFESTDFDVGINTDNFKLGLMYHKSVNEVYQAITNLGQAVGVSESWWGMYQVTLPPPFLLAGKLDPMFQQAKAALMKVGIPKTDADQEIYNQICCGPASFGTHYIGSVIVGARASMTSFVNSSFHKEFSQKEVQEQISIGFEWKKLKLSGSHNATDFEKKLLQDFKNNSHTRFEWQPDSSDIQKSDTPWLAWGEVAARSPTVVNMSVSSLAHLFFDQQQVMEHMQKTIDFYILKNQAPTLKDLSPGLSVETRAPGANLDNPTASLAPGLDVVGCGFHAPTLTSRMCLFDISTLASTWSNPYYPNISYSVPAGFMAEDTPESTILNGTVIMQSVDDYVEHSYWKEHHHSDGFLGFGSKTEDKTTEKYYRNFYAHRYDLALSMRQVSWYTLEVMEFPMPRFSSIFQEAIDALPKQYNPSNMTVVTIFEQLFEAFGTSVVMRADMGGIVWAESWFESCLSHIYSDVCITDEVTHGWWIFNKNHHAHTCDKRIVEDFAKYSSRHYEMLGGTSQVNISQWEQWSLTVKNDPRPIIMDIVPIYYLIPDSSPTKHALMNATSAFLKAAAIEKQRTIDALEKVRPPPAPVCKRSIPGETLRQDAKQDRASPQDALCPFVGYHGAFCPSLPNATFVSTEPLVQGSAPNLPRGVGLTIDVSNGDLKLPAWEFDFSDSAGTWTDPATKQDYKVPKGVSLSSDVAKENVAITRVFKTEDELVSVWEGSYTHGSWLGGEFGNSQSVSNLYSKFFSHQQSTSINQHPIALYRLTLMPGWEAHLNSYALEALKALPDQYDANVYSRFIDTWGTHVANDTLVGGMTEQQVTMKDCILESPYLSGGLSDAQLGEYLKMDLAKAPPQDPYYTSRRQMSLDHRIGGNPELTDYAAWVASLAKDPALLKIYSYKHWAAVASDAKAAGAAVVANLQRAVSDRLTAASQQRATERATTAKQRAAELQGPRPVVAIVAHGRRGSISPEEEQGQRLTLKGFADCPEGSSDQVSTAKCSTGVNIHSWNSHEITTPLRYERNSQGQMRSIRCFDLDAGGKCIDHRGPWVDKGCSEQPMANGEARDFHAPVPERTVIAAVCADCDVVASGFPQDSILKCVCPGYARDTESMLAGKGAEDCYNTFTRNMPNYKQCDPTWKCYPYAGQPHHSTCNTSTCRDGGPGSQTNNICGSGCGITSSAMLLSYWNPMRKVTPPDVAHYLVQQGFRNDLQNITGATCDGVSHVAICDAARHWGLSCNESSSFATLDEWLVEGPVIAHVRHRHWTKATSCKFTRGGHYIVITGKGGQAGNYTVSDPNSCEEVNAHGTMFELSVECELVGFVRMSDDGTTHTIFA